MEFDIWDFLSYACWAVSALILGRMFIDFLRVNQEYAGGLLLSSRELHDEILEQEKAFSEPRSQNNREG